MPYAPLIVLALLLLAFLATAAGAVRQGRAGHVGAAGVRVAGLAPLAVLLFAALVLASGGWGYRQLTYEELAAVVRTRPTGPDAFHAVFSFPDGVEKAFDLRGEQLYVDARVLKWKYWANLLGLHTSYALDRVAGRYRGLERERGGPRTVYSLATEPPLDPFELRRRLPFLSVLVDAHYGSATFIPADRPAVYEIRVSTTGLLARERPSSVNGRNEQEDPTQ